MGIYDFLNTVKTGLKTATADGIITLTGYTKKADVPGTLTIPENVQAIGASALSSMMHVTKIIVPESVKSIGEQAFAFSQALEEVVLPEGLQSVGRLAFSECENLKAVRNYPHR